MTPGHSQQQTRKADGPTLEDLDVPSILESLKQDLQDKNSPEAPVPRKAGPLKSLVVEEGVEVKVRNPGHYLFEGKRFCSRGEAATDAALEKYVGSRYSHQPGESYEVPIGISHKGHLQTVDFRIGDFLIEYHPPRFWADKKNHGDFSNAKEARQFRRLVFSGKLSKKEKRFLRDMMKERLTTNYTRRRLDIIRSNPELRHCKLLVVTDATSLYEEVIKRLADTKLPGLDKFLDEFQSNSSRVVDLSPRGKKRQNASENRRRNRTRERRKNKAALRQMTRGGYHD